MRLVVQAIPNVVQDIRKRAYRDFSMNKLTRKQLDKILESLEALKKVASEVSLEVEK